MDEEEKIKEEKRKTAHEKMAGYIYDVSKLVIAGMVIGGVSPIFSEKLPTPSTIVVMVVGLVVALGLAYFANRIINS